MTLSSSTATSSSSSTPGSTTCHPPQHSALQHTVASQVAGASSTFLLYPIDVVKMRYMSQDGTQERRHNGRYYQSVLQSLNTIRKQEGIRALFRGSHVAIVGASTAWGAYMYLYRASKELIGANHFWQDALLSLNASILSGLFCLPIWLVKTRMQLEFAEPAATRQYGGIIPAVRHIYTTTGLKGFWAGAVPQTALALPNCLSIPIYDKIKRWRVGESKEVGWWDVLLASGASKFVIMILSHPLIVIKTRMQDTRRFAGTEVHYQTLGQSLLTTARREGTAGLYRGFVPALIQAVPRSTITFVVYEFCLGLTKYTNRAVTD